LGQGVLNDLGDYAKAYAEKALLLAHPDDRIRVGKILNGSAERSGVIFTDAKFQGECTAFEADRIKREYGDGFGCIIGLGGGKALDTAKIIADDLNLPMISVPTIASNDAPCSSLAIIYDENHVVTEGRQLKRNPATVLIDTEVISKAPERFLVAGMGDAFSTYFEARACVRANVKNNGGLSTLSAFNLAKLCYDTLLADGEAALIACRENTVTPALTNIIETNIVMSGLGFESVGVAAAHGLLGPLEILGADKALHGEIVAFGTLVLLVMENAPKEEIITALDFYRKVGLPATLSGLGITEFSKEEILKAAELACEPNALIHNMPFEVTPESVCAAILCANKLESVYGA
jgi:glycerol dehydrogenase